MFAEPAYAASDKHKKFWENLRAGNYDTGEYKRIGKGGKEIWIQASYNPIFDMNGTPFKVVKFATDITPLMEIHLGVKEKSTEASANIQTVAGAAEEMLASVKEISQNMTKSQTAVSNDITRNMQGIAENVQALDDSIQNLSRH